MPSKDLGDSSYRLNLRSEFRTTANQNTIYSIICIPRSHENYSCTCSPTHAAYQSDPRFANHVAPASQRAGRSKMPHSQPLTTFDLPRLFHLVATRSGLPSVILRPFIRPVFPAVLILPPESLQSLLLGMCIDVSTNHEADEVEEWYPNLIRQECLGKGKRKWRCDPGDFHDGHETCTHSSADLMESACACDDGHGGQVDYVLDRGDLRLVVSKTALCVEISTCVRSNWRQRSA